MCKISVIMPSLNVRQYIERCMRSVLSQSLKDIEIICVDAGSIDGTFEVLQEFAEKDNRIKIFKSDIKSYGYQLNLAMKHAMGDYIGIVETDDFIDLDMYAVLYEKAVRYNVDFIKGNYKEFIENNNEVIISDYKKIRLPEKYMDVKIDLEKESEARLVDINHIWSGIYSRNFLQSNNIRFNESPGASFQDTSFSILVGTLAKNCLYADIEKYYYRIDNANSSVKSDSKINCIIDEFKYVEKELNCRDVYNKVHLYNMIEKVKINAYRWNYSRLSEDSARIFADNAREELKLIKKNIKNNVFIDWNLLESINIILGENDILEYNNNEYNNIIKLINIFKHNEKIYLIGAGDYANRILSLQEYIGKECIADIYDNDNLKVGMILNNYEIKPMDEIYHIDGKYVIANKYDCNNLYEQLRSKFDSSIEIIKCNELPQLESMINIYLEYCNN